MSRILDSRKIAIADSQSLLSFATEGGGIWKEWDRYLLFDGKKAYHMGNICGTCTFFFERLGEANASVNPSQVVADLTAGIASVSASAIDQIQKLVPVGTYFVMLNEITLSLTTPGSPSDYFAKEQVGLWGIDPFVGLPHNPKTEYYRADTQVFAGTSCLFEFVIPMFPQRWLDKQRVEKMKRLFGAGKKPTAISLSVLDVKQPADWTRNSVVTEHWCLAHYLIDGHHKAYAASQCNSPITLLSFLSLGQGVSGDEQKTKIVEIMKTLP
jgi:hypothetical protein